MSPSTGVYEKNFDVLLRAVALLRERHPVQLTLTLDELHPAFPRIAARMAILGLADTVGNHRRTQIEATSKRFTMNLMCSCFHRCANRLAFRWLKPWRTACP